MRKNKEYNIEEFYVGELYLYTNFANFVSEFYNPDNQEKINIFSKSRAIKFQEDIASRGIDWENGREYTGFLTIFYKQGDKYLCLHDGITYELNSDIFIRNLVPLNELLPQINTKLLSKITISKALELFEILFKNNKEELHNKEEYSISDFYIGDISLVEMMKLGEDHGYYYYNLPRHIMLNKLNLAIQSFEDKKYIKTVYRCLFLRQNVDLYNVNDHQFYNPNEDSIESLIPFVSYINEYGINLPSEVMSIPQACKKFKKTIR